jgi:hypothetical protein
MAGSMCSMCSKNKQHPIFIHLRRFSLEHMRVCVGVPCVPSYSLGFAVVCAREGFSLPPRSPAAVRSEDQT